MVAALVRIQFDLDGSGVFVDPPADRVIGNIRGREGRNVARLGGPDIPSQCTAVTLVLNNHDGYYTEGAGADLGPGSRMRVQWKAQASDAWVTRFQGSLSELSIRFTGFSFALTRWLGPLYRFTSGNIPGRLILNQTPQSIMGVLADAAGVAANDREFDTDATLYNRLLSPGYVGVQEVQGMLSAFIYDTPDGKVRMELPATRRAKSTVARYTDGDATAAEIGIPPPRRLTRPFGIINHVDGEYQYYIPAGNTTDTRSYTMAAITQQEFRQTPDLAIAYTRSIPVSDPIPAGASVPSFSFPFTIGEDYSTVTVDALNANFRSVPTLSFLHSYAEIRVTGFVLTPGRTSITMQYTMRIGRDDTTPADPYGLSVNFGNGSITLQSGMSFEQTIEHFPRELEDSASILRYGYRPRPSPLVIGIFQSTPLGDAFEPNYAALDAAMQLELDAYATAIPVFEIALDTGTVDRRDDLLARRLSDRVHLTADGPSKLGFDGDGFIEAMLTTISPTGEIAQQVFVQETRLPAVVSDLALGAQGALTMTQGVAFSVTLPAATGGTPPYAYSVTGEPPGLTFDDQTRVLDGTPA